MEPIVYRKSERDDYDPLRDEFILTLIHVCGGKEYPWHLSVSDVNGCWEVFRTLAAEHTLRLLEDIFRDLESGYESAILLPKLVDETILAYANGPESLSKEYLSVEGIVVYSGFNSHIRSLPIVLPLPVNTEIYADAPVESLATMWETLPYRWHVYEWEQ